MSEKLLKPFTRGNRIRQDKFNKDVDEKLKTSETGQTWKRTLITFTGETTLDTVIDISGNGATWTKYGDTPNIGIDANAFNDSLIIQVKANGIIQDKPTEITWISSTSLKIKRIFNTGETLFIES